MANNKKLKFFLVSDIVEGSSKNNSIDKKFLNNMKSVIESHGHQCKVIGVDPNLHTQSKKYGCTSRDEVWCCVVGGVCAGTLKDMSSKYAKNNRGNAWLVWCIRTDHVKYDLENLKYLKKAHDDNFSPKSFKGLDNPVKYMNKNKIGRCYGSTAQMMAENLVSNSIGHIAGGSGNIGKIFKEWTDEGMVDTNVSDDKSETQSYGFDTSAPFRAYIKIVFTIDDPNGKEREALFDFTSNAPDKGYSFSNEKLVLVNNEFRENRINVYEKLQQAFGGKNHKFYLKEIWLEDYIPLPDKTTVDEDKTASNKLYDDKNDFASYKLLISECGFSNFETVNSVNVGLSGKTLLDGIKECMEKTDYLYKIRYGKYRYQDRIDFYKDTEYNTPQREYTQGYNGNILSVSSVTYAPLSTLHNNSIVVFKSQPDSNDEHSIKYEYVQSRYPDSVLRYGESTVMSTASENVSPYEAYYQARVNKDFMVNMDIAYSIVVAGFDGIEIMDWARTVMNRSFYNDIKRVNSIEVTGDVTQRPMIKTTLGLGAIDKKMRVQKKLAQQRKSAKKKVAEVTGGITFNTDYSFLEE